MSSRARGPGSSVWRCGSVSPANSVEERVVFVSRSVLDDRLALLVQVLLHVVQATPGLPRGAGALPAAERLHAGPGPGRRAGLAVHVDHPGLDVVEELVDLRLVLGVE